HGDAANVIPHHLALARMQAGTNADSGRVGGSEDRAGAMDRAGRAVERSEEAVAGRLDLAAVEADQRLAHSALVALQQLAPLLVAELGRPARGIDDVGE